MPTKNSIDRSRRSFLKGASLAGTASLFASSDINASAHNPGKRVEAIQAKNLIFLVADGMGTGTLSLAHHWKLQNEGSDLNWMQLYGHAGVVTGLQDTASASSPVTDSAAAASAWGSGRRVNNGAINTGVDGRPQTPIMSYAKAAGKRTGLVTTCRVTHATPAGFSANVPHRNSEGDIADQYFEREIDVMLGGGLKYFDRSRKGEGGANLLEDFEAKGYSIVFNQQDLLRNASEPKLLGLFSETHIPYAIDRKYDEKLANTPSLPKMFQAALESLNSPEGFVLQVEAGRVDHAGHVNDPAAILHEQLEFDACIPIAIEFAKAYPDTMVIVTTDHGTGGCQLNGAGTAYNDSDISMDRLNDFRGSFESLEFAFRKSSQIDRKLFQTTTGIQLNGDQSREIQKSIDSKAPYLAGKIASAVSGDLFDMTAVGWTSNNHTSECVELLCWGPGSSMVKPFMKNYELFDVMAEALQLKV